MREILFRGKRICNNEWVEGGFHSRFGKAYIIGISKTERIDGTEVIPETVGQYTGLTDKNGKKIFEGDIGKGFNMLHPDRKIYQVVYEGNGFYYCDEDGVTWHPDHIDNFEIIGNIYDNPELLKGGE